MQRVLARARHLCRQSLEREPVHQTIACVLDQLNVVGPTSLFGARTPSK